MNVGRDIKIDSRTRKIENRRLVSPISLDRNLSRGNAFRFVCRANRKPRPILRNRDKREGTLDRLRLSNDVINENLR